MTAAVLYASGAPVYTFVWTSGRFVWRKGIEREF
jgi:hypothetical protein